MCEKVEGSRSSKRRGEFSPDGGLLGSKAPDWSLSKAGETGRGDARDGLSSWDGSEVVLMLIILNYRMTHFVFTDA